MRKSVNRSLLWILTISFLLSLPLTANANTFLERAFCTAPKKPLQFVTDLDKQKFDQKVDAYRACLEEFVLKQNNSIKMHQSSAQGAADQWKQYAEEVLGATVTPAETNPQDQSSGQQPANSQGSKP